MSRVIAAYDLDEDHGRLWVNADLERMPEIVIVANQPMDRAQTVTYVPETRLIDAMDAAREAGRRADVAERVAADHKGLCDSLKETNDDLRRIIDEMKEIERPVDENDKLRELVHILCYCMHEGTDCDGCKLNDGRGEMGLDVLWACEGLHERLRELGIEVSR